jgi:uncharacterized protein with HEPN domain
MSPSPVEFIKHIHDECSYLLRLFNENSFEDITSNRTLAYAICRSLEIVGEATKNVPEELRIKYPLVEWRKMAGIRDKIIHDYFGIDYDIIWKTIETKIPSLKEWLEIIIEKESN